MDLAFWVCVIWLILSKLFSHSFECLLYSPLGGNNQSEITLSTHRDLIIYLETGMKKQVYICNFQIPNDTPSPCREAYPEESGKPLKHQFYIFCISGIYLLAHRFCFPHNLVFQCCIVCGLQISTRKCQKVKTLLIIANSLFCKYLDTPYS